MSALHGFSVFADPYQHQDLSLCMHFRCGSCGIESYLKCSMQAVGSLLARCVREGRIAPRWETTATHHRLWIGFPRSFAHEVLRTAAVEPQTPMTGYTFAATHVETVTEVRRKNQQLRAVLKTLPWPKLRRFQAHGRVYDLPLRASSGKSDLPLDAPDSRLRYLAGFFDGDGTVACTSSLSGCFLQVGQSFDQAEILMLLRETLGGSIGLNRDGIGLKKPYLQWVLCGQAARRAASSLAPLSITKQQQLLLAAQWPDSKAGREQCKAELRDLKKYDSAVAGPCSWEYCAGFFDAEGYVGQQHAGDSLALEIAQKHPRVLMCLRKFLVETLGVGTTMTTTDRAHRLHMYGRPGCKSTLQQMLEAGLLRKAKQAELALSLTAENTVQVNAELRRLTGNQQFGKRMDRAGQERARMIVSLTRSARKMMKEERLQEAEAKLRNLDVLRIEHKLLNALQEREELLRYESYIRDLHSTCWEGPLADHF